MENDRLFTPSETKLVTAILQDLVTAGPLPVNWANVAATAGYKHGSSAQDCWLVFKKKKITPTYGAGAAASAKPKGITKETAPTASKKRKSKVTEEIYESLEERNASNQTKVSGGYDADTEAGKTEVPAYHEAED